MPFTPGDRVRFKIDKDGIKAGGLGTIQSVSPSGRAYRVVADGRGNEISVGKTQIEAANEVASSSMPSLGERSAVTSLSPEWQIQEARTGRAQRRAVGELISEIDGRPDVPAYLLQDPLELYQRVEARRTGSDERRTGNGASRLTFAVRAKPGESLVAAARHPSGALTFHLPDLDPVFASRRAVGAAAHAVAPDAITFTIDINSEHVGTGILESNEGGVRRSLAGKLVKIVILKIVDRIVDVALPVLARRLEERLWSTAQRKEGWVKIAERSTVDARLLSQVPNFGPDQRGLLFLHGTFSHTASAFRELFTSPAFADLRARYGEHIYGFDHFSISKSPAENVADLLAGLPPQSMTFDVITHSRGGLVLLSLAADAGATSRIKIGRVVLVASPTIGTPLATPARWEETLGWFANLMELFPDNPFTFAGGWIAGSLSWLAQRVTGLLPGLAAMDVNGETIQRLTQSYDAKPAPLDWYALVANWQAPPNLVARLADMGVDAFFQSKNDLVVPTDGGWHLGHDVTSALPASRIGCFGAGGNLAVGQSDAVNHVTFFQKKEAQEFIRNVLDGRSAMVAPVVREAFTAPRSTVPLSNVSISSGGPQPSVPSSNAVSTAETMMAAVNGENPIDNSGWALEDALHLIVLPASRSDDTPDNESAQLLAIYGSARVLSEFRLRGAKDGQRWNTIIDFQKRIDRYVEGDAEAPSPDEIQSFGQTMFDTLFQGEVRRLYDQARYRHRNRKLNVVLTSMIPWVADLPWEFAFDSDCKAFLATSDVRFIRNVLTSVPADKIVARNTAIRILVVSAQPGSAAKLSVADEEARILDSFRHLIDRGAVIIDTLTRATPAKLHAWVRQRTYDVIHFIGHGGFDKTTQTGYLLFEDPAQGEIRLATKDVRDILRGRGIKLVFLNACESGRSGRAYFNQGVALGLVADGAPAVVANQYSVLDRSATTFSQYFYWCLAQGLSLGDAAREARIALNYSGAEVIDWAVPVLFAHNPDARLCEALVRSDVPQIMPIGEKFAWRSQRDKVKRVAIWDVAGTFPELDEAIERMNAVQPAFEFQRVNMTAPFGTFRAGSGQEGSSEYVESERAARRLRPIVNSLDLDLLLCVTDLPLATKDTWNIYLWGGEPEVKNNKIGFFSTWGFQPSIEGEAFQSALANVAVQFLAQLSGDLGKTVERKGSIFYYNAERARQLVVGQLVIDARNRLILAGHVSARIMAAFESLLTAFHYGGTSVRPTPPPLNTQPTKQPVKRPRKRKKRR